MVSTARSISSPTRKILKHMRDVAQPAVLATYVDRDGNPGIWVLKLPRDDPRTAALSCRKRGRHHSQHDHSVYRDEGLPPVEEFDSTDAADVPVRPVSCPPLMARAGRRAGSFLLYEQYRSGFIGGSKIGCNRQVSPVFALGYVRGGRRTSIR
jgi:hypothetical protein